MSDPTHQDQLSAYLDGELEGGELSRLEAELRVNPKLRAELEELREVVTFVRSNARVVAPRGFHERVMARVDAEAPAKPWWAWLRRPFGVPIEGFAVALAAAAVLLLALPKEPASPTPHDEVDDEAATEAPKAAAKSEVPASKEEAPEEQGQRQELANAGDAAPPAGTRGADENEPAPLQIIRGNTAATKAGTVASNTAEPALDNTATGDLEDAVADVDNTAAEGLGGLLGGVGTTEGDLGGLGTVGKGQGGGGAGYGYGAASGTTAPAPAVSPLPGSAEPFKYKVYADDWSVLAGLQRAAARYQGTLRHTDGSVVQGGQQTSQVATYVVRIPSASLQSFHRDVEKLGVNVVQEAKGSDFSDTWIEVSVTVVLLGPARSDAKVDAYQDAME